MGIELTLEILRYLNSSCQKSNKFTTLTPTCMLVSSNYCEVKDVVWFHAESSKGMHEVRFWIFIGILAQFQLRSNLLPNTEPFNETRF